MTFRSGWCGLAAQPWSHARCVGSSPKGSPCVCSCHRQPAEPVSLRDLVDVAVLEQLVDMLGQVVALPGVVPPAAHRLRAAAVELLADLTPVEGPDRADVAGARS